MRLNNTKHCKEVTTLLDVKIGARNAPLLVMQINRACICEERMPLIVGNCLLPLREC